LGGPRPRDTQNALNRRVLGEGGGGSIQANPRCTREGGGGGELRKKESYLGVGFSLKASGGVGCHIGAWKEAKDAQRRPGKGRLLSVRGP